MDYVGLSSIPADATFDVVQPKDDHTNSHAGWSGPCGLIHKQATSRLSRGLRCGQKKKMLLYYVHKGPCHSVLGMIIVMLQNDCSGFHMSTSKLYGWVQGKKGKLTCGQGCCSLRRFGGLIT